MQPPHCDGCHKQETIVFFTDDGKFCLSCGQNRAAVIPNENAPVGSPERAAWQAYENRRARKIMEGAAVASGLGFDEDHSVETRRYPGRGSVKRSHRAEGRNWVD